MIANFITLFVTLEYPTTVDPAEVRTAVDEAIAESTDPLLDEDQLSDFTVQLAET